MAVQKNAGVEQNKTTHFLWASLVGVAAMCVCVFTFLAFHMGSTSAHTINEVGSFYMSSMSEQISLHFETTMNLRLEQVEALASTVAPAAGSAQEEDGQRDALVSYAQALGFEYLAFYGGDNTFEMLYGSPLAVTDPGPFLASLSAGQKKVAVGSDGAGNSVILMGVPAVRHGSIALVGALPVDYITRTLSLDDAGDHEYSHIIRSDGSFVVRSSDASRDSYFERVLALYDDVDGKTPQQYLDELSAAMTAGEDYSSEFTIGGERRHLYCTHLANSEWYLLTFMPYNTMNSIVSALNRQWAASALLGAALILAVILAVFAVYLRLTRQQMQALEAAWRDADAATKAKSEFLSNMSHDIRTPMNAIVGMTAIATANIDDKAQVENCLKKITLSSKHLLGLINDVLDMSKIESGKMTLTMDQVSLGEVMAGAASIIQPQADAKHQQFQVDIHDISADSVYCDSVRLNQVLLNLLSNAIKFTPDGGSISAVLYEEPSPKGEQYVRVHLSVEDTGIGMSPEFRDKIFESFSREDNARVHRTEGTGLGMAITKYIVDAMEGSIEVDSTQGVGTRFRVTLDLEKAEGEAALPQWNTPAADGGEKLLRRRVLLAEDNELNWEIARELLQSVGLELEWAENGQLCVEMFQASAPGYYDAILMDIRMPVMTGYEAARAIRALDRPDAGLPIIAMTADAFAEDVKKALDAGMNAHIAKPIDLKEVSLLLGKYLAP